MLAASASLLYLLLSMHWLQENPCL